MPQRPLDRTVDRPLWAQLHDYLMSRLAAGEFTAAFPGELALTAEYGVSRHTVREALRRLRAEGLVTAERGRAPRLATGTEIEQPFSALYSLFASVEAAGLVQRSITRQLDIRADGVVAARLGLEESTPLLYLERLRLAGEQPLAADRVWLPAALAAPLLEVDFTHTALYDELARRCGLRPRGGCERITAVVPTLAERTLLGIDRPAATATGQPTDWTAGRSPALLRLASYSELAAARERTDVVVLDVRRRLEWADAHVAGAHHIPFHELPSRITDIPHGQVWTYCRTGHRSTIAASILAAHGRTSVSVNDDFDNGIAAGLPIDTGDTP